MEIIGCDFFCNLHEVHLNQLHRLDFIGQYNAFKAAAIACCALLHHKFTEPRYQYSRDLDPIVGVSFTGLFDFCVNLFGAEWLRWWELGRPKNWGRPIVMPNLAKKIKQCQLENKKLDDIELEEYSSFNCVSDYFLATEQEYLSWWKEIVFSEVKKYCDQHNLKVPNRCTTLQPAGTKSNLSNASSGWHAPKAIRYIRRVTFDKNNPIALACLDYGYSVIPGQDDKDENGILLDNIYDDRCNQWLVEIPCQTDWADLPGCDQINVANFPIDAQWDFYMQVQKFYTTHNTSATLEITKEEIPKLAHLIYNAIQADEGYVSAAVLARFEDQQTYPRMPFEPISKQTFEQLQQQVMQRRKSDNFIELLAQYDNQAIAAFEQGAAPCDSDKCLLEFPKK